MLLLGIDLGTTNCKLCVYDLKGNFIEGSSFRTPTHHPQSGWAEYDSKMIWEEMGGAVRQLTERTASIGRIKAIAISSQAESGLLLDEANRPLTPIIAWYDERTIGTMKDFSNYVSDKELFDITGISLNSIHSILKVQWLKENKPEIYNKSHSWMCMSDYFSFLLCGVKAIDYSLASRTMAFDISGGGWSDRLLSIAGIPNGIFPPPVPAGTPLGLVSSNIANELGLSEDVVVCSGGFDHMCGSLAVGMVSTDQIVASMGTTESVCAVRRSYPLDPEGVRKTGCTIGRYVLPDLFYLLGGIPSGGLTVEWAIKSLLGRPLESASFNEFSKLCKNSRPGSRGLFFVPHLRGCVTPEVNTQARGAFIGISSEHSQEDLCRSVIEGLCYEFRLVLESMGGEKAKAITAMGGGTRNEFWLKTKADVLGIPIRVTSIKDAPTLGAALLAGVGAKVYSSAAEALAALDMQEEWFEPDLANHRKYTDFYNVTYKQLYHNIKGIAR